MLSQAEAATASGRIVRIGGEPDQRRGREGLLGELRAAATARREPAFPARSRRWPAIRSSPATPIRSSASCSTGLHGSISVNGQTYNGMMPAWKGTLSNKDVADVVTYIRGSLGSNKASAVTEAQVAGYKP